MMKIMGCLFIMLACSGAGFTIAQGFVNRTREIRQLQNILAYIETEIMYGQTPLNEIVENIGKKEVGNIATVFQNLSSELSQGEFDFSECWQRAFLHLRNISSLKDPEIEIMLQVGKTLGKSDRFNQQKNLRIAQNHLQAEEQNALEQQKRYERLSRTLGVLSGILLVILLI